jgi:hypothetical protein
MTGAEMDDSGVRKVLAEMLKRHPDALFVGAGRETFTVHPGRALLDDTGIRWIADSGHSHWVPYHAIAYVEVMGADEEEEEGA